MRHLDGRWMLDVGERLTKRIPVQASGLLVSAMALAMAPGALAQSTTAPPAPPTSDSAAPESTLGEIVVTARRREESIQNVPLSVDVTGAQDIVNQGAHNVADLQYSTPNVYFGNPNTGATSVYIRGIGDFTRNIGIDSRVSTYVDGVYVGSSIAVDQGLVDVDRIEILRGPQGTLFGKNTVAGAINIVTKRPGPDFEGSLDVSIGSYQARRISAGLNIPLAHNLFVRGGVQYQKRDGFVRNIFDGGRLANIDRLTGRVQLRYEPSDNLTIDLEADAMRDHHTIYYKLMTENPLSPGGYTGPDAPFVANLNTDPLYRINVRGGSSTAKYEFDNGGALIGIVAYRYNRLRNQDDQDLGPILAADSQFDTRYKQVTAELRYESPDDRPLTYVAGLYYLNSRGRVNLQAASLIFPTSIAQPPAASDNLLIRSAGTSTTDSYAAFANGTYALTDRLKLELGGRLIREKKGVDYAQVTSLFTTFALALPSYSVQDSFWKTAFTPSASLSFQANRDLLFYARASRGYKSGGYNADVVADDNIRFDPEYVNAAELGLKSTLLDGHLRFNADVFISKHTDYQVFQFTIQGASTIIQLRNAGRATAKGFEFELVAEPVSGLRLSADGGYVDAKFTRFDDCAGIGVDCAGQRLIGAPKFTGNLSALLRQEVGGLGELSLFGQYSYRGSAFTNIPNAPNVRTQSVGIVNGSIGFKPEGTPIEIYANVKNLFDTRRVEAAAFTFLQSPFATYNLPRMFEFGVRAKF
jgi:iron complex outermembrane receptor protein